MNAFIKKHAYAEYPGLMKLESIKKLESAGAELGATELK